MKKNQQCFTPEGESPLIFEKIIDSGSHVLIAGATGSGKSVFLNGLIWSILYRSPGDACLVLLDPKKVEFWALRRLPHVVAYEDDPDGITDILRRVALTMDNRFIRMRKLNKKQTEEGDVFVIIDEFADIVALKNREAVGYITRIAQLGRAAGIRLIIATQRPTADIVPGTVKVNVDIRVALHVPSAQDSRNLIGVSGAELLPKVGECLLSMPGDDIELWEAPYITEEEIADRVAFWEKQWINDLDVDRRVSRRKPRPAPEKVPRLFPWMVLLFKLRDYYNNYNNRRHRLRRKRNKNENRK